MPWATRLAICVEIIAKIAAIITAPEVWLYSNLQSWLWPRWTAVVAMPGKYAPPAGELLLSRDHDGAPMGCVGLRPLDAHGCCEMKRLYVVPEGRGSGLGRKLVDAVVKEAERIGYREMRLDTLPSMTGAIALYRKLGFEPIEPYYATPVIGTIFMRRSLAGSACLQGKSSHSAQRLSPQPS